MKFKKSKPSAELMPDLSRIKDPKSEDDHQLAELYQRVRLELKRCWSSRALEVPSWTFRT